MCAFRVAPSHETSDSARKKRIPLPIHGGGIIEVYGTFPCRRVVLLLSRDDCRRDDELMSRVASNFVGRNMTVIRYLPEFEAVSRIVDQEVLRRFPRMLRQFLKASMLLCYPRYWRSFSTTRRIKLNGIPYRCESLRTLIRWLGPELELFLFARSASCRVATMVADEMNVSRVVCMGYPLRHPREAPDPKRYSHLAAMRTPCLIVQGHHDQYGSPQQLAHAGVGSNTRIQPVDASHNYIMSKQAWTQVLESINRFYS